MMSRVGKTEGAGALHRGILEARLEKRAILPNFNVDIRDPKFLIGLRLSESNLRFRNFGFEMGFCPISQFPRPCYSSMLLPSQRRGWRDSLIEGGSARRGISCVRLQAPAPTPLWSSCPLSLRRVHRTSDTWFARRKAYTYLSPPAAPLCHARR